MLRDPTILGAVLVGGESRRMGRDKALLPFAGGTLAGHVAAVLEEVFSEVVLVGGDGGRFPGHTLLADRFPGRGPMAGLHAALLHAAGTTGRAVYLAACDLPGLCPELVRHVAGAPGPLPRGAWARVPVADGRLQPLAALYSAACLEPVEELLGGGQLAMSGLLDRVAVTRVPISPELPFYREGLLANVNRPEDVSRSTGGFPYPNG